MNKSYVPVYPYSLEEAQRNGETDLYKQSRAENIACAQAIKAGISENFDGYRLNTDFLKDVIKGHGYDRTMYVLANTIQHFDYDGRISRDNKEWANTFFIPDNRTHGFDLNTAFIIDNPGLVNLVTDQARREFEKLGLWNSEHCIPPDGLDFENKIMVLNPTGIKDEYKTPDYQLFYAQSGFGCSPTARGRQVYGRFLADGEYTHFERSRFLGQLKPGLVPDWAKEKVMEFEKPSIKKQLAELPKQTEPKQKSIDKGAR